MSNYAKARTLFVNSATLTGLLLSASTLAIVTPNPAYAAQAACVVEDEEEILLAQTAIAFACIKFYGGVTRYGLPSRNYLGIEIGGSSNPELGLVTADPVIWAPTFGGDFELGTRFESPLFNKYEGIQIRGNFEYASGDASENIGQLDVGPGNLLLLPGSGNAGISLDNDTNPNTVEDASYSGDLDWSIGTVNVELLNDEDSYATTSYIGFSYQTLNMGETFGGSIPGYLSDFQYNTDIDTKSFGIHGGFRARVDVGPKIGFNWQPQLSFRGQLGVAFTDATVHDEINYDGFLDPQDSDTTINKSNTAAYYTVGGAAALNYEPTNTQIFIDAAYEHRPWFGKVIRDGFGPADFEYEGADIFAIRTGLRLQF